MNTVVKVQCTSQCTDGKTLFRYGKEYDIPKALFDENKAFFKKVKKQK